MVWLEAQPTYALIILGLTGLAVSGFIGGVLGHMASERANRKRDQRMASRRSAG